MKSLLAAVFVCCMVDPGQAQSFVLKFEKISTPQGLSHNIVRAATEDRHHNLWIATEGGLDFYNGFQVREFTSTNSPLQSDVIRMVHLLSDGRLVINTAEEEQFMNSEGLYIMNPGMNIVRLPGFDAGPNTFGMLASQFYRDAFYVIDQDQLWTYAVLKDAWTKHNLPDGFHPQHIADGFILGEWNGQQRLVHVLQPDTFISENELPAADSAFAFTYAVLDTLIAFGGDFTITNSIYDPWRKLVWSCKSSALMATNLQGYPQTLNGCSTPLTFHHLVQSISLASNGLLLLSTYDGLYLVRISPLNFKTHQLSLPESAIPGFAANSTRGICVADHYLYLNLDQYFVRQNLLTSGPAEILYTNDENRLFALYNDGRSIWSARQQLIRYNTEQQQTAIVRRSLPGMGGLWSFYHDQHLYYLGGQNGVFVFDSSGLAEDKLRIFCQTRSPGQFQIVFQILQTHQGLFYVTSNGLQKASPDPCRPSTISILYPNGVRCAVSYFTSLYEDRDSTFWLTSKDGGILHIRAENDSAVILDQLDRDAGLTTNTAYAIYPDQFGNYWISTDQGIIRFDKQTRSFIRYTVEDGLPDNEFNRISHFQDTDGRIFFGGVRGVVSFRPEDFYNTTDFADSLRWLKITQFITWDDTVVDVTAEVARQNRIIFHPGDKFIRFEVGLTDLFRTNVQRYEYRIQDVNAEWEHMQGNVLTIHMLPYGKHTLEIRARDADGRFAQQAFGLLIIARRPFYFRWWFVALVAVGLTMIIREYLIQRTQRAEQRARDLEAIVQERTTTISQQADALRDLQQVRSRFFANISHELRTPLTLIRGPVQSLLHRFSKPSEEHTYLELIRQNAESLGDRIDDLLLLSRMDARQLQVHPVDFELTSFLERTMDVFRVSASEKKINLESHGAVLPPVWIRADRKKLEHILSNYISNAIKFTPPHGHIMVKTEMEAHQLILRVQDDGPGISETDAGKVFDRFYQVKDAREGYAGTGIGLSICRELAEMLGGTVGLESAPGKGSTFYARIPVAPGAEDHLQTDPIAERESGSPGEIEAPNKTPGSKSLLIVEDNAALRDFLHRELNMYQIWLAAHGKEALQLLEKLQQDGKIPDGIISDVMMPEMDGFELLQAIKSDERFSGIPFIMLTARAGVEDKLEALRIGVHDYITKPFDVEELRIRISNLLQHQAEKKEAMQEEPGMPPMDHPWLKDVEAHVMEHISERDYSVARLALDLFLSESQFLRRLKAYTGLTPVKYLREVRLFHAKTLLESGEYRTVATLSDAVGFEDPNYFSRIFMERFGYRPAEKM